MFGRRGDSVGALALFFVITFAFAVAIIPTVRFDLLIPEFLAEVLR